MLITTSSVLSLQAKRGLPLVNQMTGWIVLGEKLGPFRHSSLLMKGRLVIASMLPFIYGRRCPSPSSKLLLYFLGFGPCFILLSISVEGLFYVSYVTTLAAWVIVESIVRNGTPDLVLKKEKIYTFQLDDLRIGLFFLFFVQVGFFGIGK